MSAIGSLSQIAISASLPRSMTPTSPARLTGAELPLVLIVKAEI
jgi:hypothetical protein